MGLLDEPLPGLFRSRERPLFVPEQEALHQRFRQRGAVHHHEVPPRPAAVVMDGPGKKLLPGSGFTGNHHRGVAGGRLGHQVQAIPHLMAVADDVMTLEGGDARAAAGNLLLPVLERAHEMQGHRLKRSPLFDIVPSPAPDGQFG